MTHLSTTAAIWLMCLLKDEINVYVVLQLWSRATAANMSVPLRSTKSGDAFDHEMKMQKVSPFSAQPKYEISDNFLS